MEQIPKSFANKLMYLIQIITDLADMLNLEVKVEDSGLLTNENFIRVKSDATFGGGKKWKRHSVRGLAGVFSKIKADGI